MVVDGDDSAEELDSVIFLEGDPVIDAALHDFVAGGFWVERFGLCIS